MKEKLSSENSEAPALEWLDSEVALQRPGARALLWAVFLDGIGTYCRAIATRSTAGREYREAESWIFGRRGDGLTGFTSLCDLFGLDSTKLRRELLRFRDEPRPELLRLLERRNGG